MILVVERDAASSLICSLMSLVLLCPPWRFVRRLCPKLNMEEELEEQRSVSLIRLIDDLLMYNTFLC